MECLKFMKDLSRFSNHVLKNKTFVGKVFMDHSKACDCIPCDLLIAKLHAYCLFICTYIYIYIYIYIYSIMFLHRHILNWKIYNDQTPKFSKGIWK